MILAKVLEVAKTDKAGLVYVSKDNVKFTYRYYFTPDLELKVGDEVLGDAYSVVDFSVLCLAPKPATLLKVDFPNRRYAVEKPTGEVVGWFHVGRSNKLNMVYSRKGKV